MQYDSLDLALTGKRIPRENWPLIRRITEYIGVRGYQLASNYVKAGRSNGGPDLHIYYGYTGGFMSEQEAINAAGDVERWQFDGRGGLWSILHPENKTREGGGGNSRRAHRESAVCPNCYLTVPSNNICDTCGWDQSEQR